MRSVLTRLTRLEATAQFMEAPPHEQLIQFVDTNHRVVETLLLRSEPRVLMQKHRRGRRRGLGRQTP